MSGAARPRLLFVLSHDYGELFRATYLLAGHNFDPVFALPERLYAVNHDALPGRTLRYRSLADVCTAVDAERPDVVFLFSGYLYTVNNIFHVATVEALLRELARRGRRVVTSDPFQGVLASIDDTTFSDAHPRKAWLTWVFSRLARAFEDVTHLYYIDVEGLVARRTVSFFNRHVVVAPGYRGGLRATLARAFPLADTPRWVFVLALEDYAAQAAARGREAVDALVLAHLGQAAGHGRQPVLVAPQPCLASLGDRVEAVAGAVALPFLPVETFTALVTEAECVFYWNIFSNTSMLRILNSEPFFAFDRGHMARAMPTLFESAARWHDCGEPAYLDPAEPLRPDRLATLAKVQEAAMRGPRERFERAPQPAEMLARLLSI